MIRPNPVHQMMFIKEALDHVTKIADTVVEPSEDFFDWQSPFKPDGRRMLRVSKAERKLPDFEWDL